MPDDPKDDEIREVMAEEKSRGKRPQHLEARKLHKQRLEALRVILGFKREQEAINAIRALGHGDDPKELEEILKVWRALSSSKKP
jgi:hypothetical protein